MKRRAACASPALVAWALAACAGDDVTVVAPAPVAHGSPTDATVYAPPDAADDADDAAPAAPADAAPPRCVRLRDAGADAGDAGADADDAGADADAESADGAADASRDAGPCAPRVLARVDFDEDPALARGGRTPHALSIGHAGIFDGPSLDRRGEPGACYLATHPGAIYLDDEDAWAELPAFALGAAAGCPLTLHAWVWYELEDGHDAANLVVLAGGAARNIGLADGPSLYDLDAFTDDACGAATCLVDGQSVWSSFALGATSWREAKFDVSSFAGLDDVRVRLQFHSDHAADYQGIYVQDVMITTP